MSGNKVTRSFRISPDIAEKVDEYVDEKGLTKSEGYRRVLELGIDSMTEDDENQDQGLDFGTFDLFITLTGYLSLVFALSAGLFGIIATLGAFLLSTPQIDPMFIAVISAIFLVTWLIIAGLVFIARLSGAADRAAEQLGVSA